jgi:hypothetical protein
VQKEFIVEEAEEQWLATLGRYCTARIILALAPDTFFLFELDSYNITPSSNKPPERV